MTKKQDEARKFLDELEKNPKHRTRTPEALKQTKDDDINDPRFHDKRPSNNPHAEDDQIDASWKRGKHGEWYQEGGE